MVFQDFLWDSAKVMFLDEPEVAHHITYCLLDLFLSNALLNKGNMHISSKMDTTRFTAILVTLF